MRLLAVMFSKLWHGPQQTLIFVVRMYRLVLSPWLGNACRFEPTCSAYALQALRTRGAVAGTYLTLHRLARCNPWCEGGYDPVVPARSRRLFTRLFTPKKTNSSSEKTPS